MITSAIIEAVNSFLRIIFYVFSAVSKCMQKPYNVINAVYSTGLRPLSSQDTES